MALDPYAPCSCGTPGKKFKFCCMPIYAGINQAYEQESQGQHDTAERIMNEVVAKHGDNPEAWGQLARLLFMHGKLDEAEAALEKAFAVNPNYPFGLLLRANFRYQEGELAGALLLARKAALNYAAEAHDRLAEVYYLIFDCELKLNRPVAARAALQLVLRYQPAEQELRDNFEELFGDKGRQPAAARRAYELIPPTAERQVAWDKARKALGGPRLADLVGIYEPLTREDNKDAAAFYNLGLAYAWLGDNRPGLEAINRYVELETDEDKAGTAAALAEVLRCGIGMEDDSDYHEYSFAFPIRDPQVLSTLLQEWYEGGRLIKAPSPREGVLFFLLLEGSTSGLITAGGPAKAFANLAGYVVIVNSIVRIWGPNKEAIARLREEVRTRVHFNLGEAQEVRGPIQFTDVVSEAIVFPTAGADSKPEEIINHAATFYEAKWVNRPRRSLMSNTPVDATSSPNLRKRLRGVIQFVQDCAALGVVGTYDFNRLRRKLGLISGAEPVAVAATTTMPAATSKVGDISAMSVNDLSALATDDLSFEQREQGYQAALKQDAHDLGYRFAESLVASPPEAGRSDRYSWYAYLIQRDLLGAKLDAALDHVNDGEKADCEQNEGRRRNDFELLRGKVLVKRGEVDEAEQVFRRLIDRVPSELKYRGNAAEAMLALKQSDKALRFAEEGVTQARTQKDRDSEQYLMELVSAAKKQKG